MSLHPGKLGFRRVVWPVDRNDEPPTDPLVARQVLAEQVRSLYRQSAPVLLANAINAVIVCIVLWSHSPHGPLLTWTVTMALMALARIELRRRYWTRERTLEEQPRWGARSVAGSFVSGSLWGLLASALLPATLSQQVVVLFVVGGMAAGAAGSLSCHMGAFFAFVVPALVPTISRLVWFGDSEHVGMAAMTVLYLISLTMIARNVHRAFSEAFRLRFENAGLYAQVSGAQTALVAANERLRSVNEELEMRVRQRTEQLHASERQLSEIVSESPDAIVVYDEAGRILSANRAAAQISGRAGTELVGLDLANSGALHARDRRRAISTFRAVLRGEQPDAREFHVTRPDGQMVVVEQKLRVVSGVDGQRRVHGVIRDITERHRLRKLRQAYEGRLREAERLESVGMLAGGVAHDFNNVLTMILSNVALLEASGSDPDGKALLGEIRHGSLQVANMTKQLLAFSRKQVLDVKPTDLASVVSNARVIFERALGERNTLDLRLPVKPTVVLVDATQIELALLNMLVNARHAMPGGGRVEVAVRRVVVSIDPNWPDAEPGVYVELSIADTGTGMDEATLGRVFEPFFTTKEIGLGTGLGLSSVHGVVKQAGGHIRVSSTLGHGSRFEILLPCHNAPAPALEGTKLEAPVWTAGSGTVLVVEDQQQVRRSLTHILEEAGYHVIAAEHGEQALSLARKRKGRIDLLVTDVIMPGVSGVELSRRLLAQHPDLAILLVSGYTGGEIKEVAELSEQVQFLQKPFDAVSLTSAARAAVERARAAARLRTEGRLQRRD
jgi:two-component system, cell cycle sensor histidine kinase and response regulator CckA